MNKTIPIDPLYIDGDITTKTMLTQRTSVGTFVSGNRLDALDEAGKRTLCDHLYLHAHILDTVQNTPYFKDHALQVVQSVPDYAFESENPEYGTSFNPENLVSRLDGGIAVCYSLVDRYGHTNIAMNFEVANFIAEYMNITKVVLDYDTYDPQGILNCQVIVYVPETIETTSTTLPTLTANFDSNRETWFNNKIMSSADLLELQL